MRKLKLAGLALAFIALPVLVWAGIANAQRFSATIDEGEVVDSSLYSAGQNIDINGTINGDVFCMGQNVRIDAVVHGDIICAGQNVTIKGEVDGNIRAAGQTVTIDAQVTRSLTVAGQTVSLDADARVGSDVTAMGDSLNMKGTVERDTLLNGATVILNGMVGRNVESNAENVDVRANAQIGGNLTYTSRNEATFANAAQIAGETTRNIPEADSGTFIGIGIAMYVYFLAAFLLLALIVVLLFPQAVRKTNDVARHSFGKTILTGFLAGLAIPVAAFALAVTFIGLPLAVLLLMLWGVLICLTVPVAGYFLAKLVLKKTKNTVVVTLIGTAVVMTLCFVPFIGFIAALLTYWIGSGAILIALKHHIPKPVYRG